MFSVDHRHELTAEWITTSDRLDALYPDWQALFATCEAASPFLHPAWVTTWWASFGSAALRVLAIRRRGQLVGVSPLMRRWGRQGLLPVRRYSSLWNGQSPRPGFLLAQRPDAVAPYVLDALGRTAMSWDLVALDGLRDDEYRLVIEGAEGSGRWTVLESEPWSHSYLPLEGDWHGYLGGKTAKFRKTLRYTENVLAREGAVEGVLIDQPDRVDSALDAFVELDGRSWKADGGEALRHDERLVGYYRRLMAEFARTGSASVFFLRLEGIAIAGVLCLRVANVLYTLKTSFDDRYTKFSPGTVLFHYLIEDAYQRGYHAIDFVGKMPFSDRWTDRGRRFWRVVLANHAPYSGLLRAVAQRRPLAATPSSGSIPRRQEEASHDPKSPDRHGAVPAGEWQGRIAP